MSVVEFGHFGQMQLMGLAWRPGGNSLRKERPGLRPLPTLRQHVPTGERLVFHEPLSWLGTDRLENSQVSTV